MEMRILLLSRNRVVQELVKLGIKGRDEVRLEIAETLSEIKGDRYDLLLADDQMEEATDAERLEHLIAGRRILLGGEERAEEQGYDGCLEKPFLPGDIGGLLDRKEERRSGREDEDLAEFLEMELEGAAEDTAVLDGEEIRRIRRLLDGEEVSVSQMRDGGESTPAERPYDAETLLEMLERIKPKRLRRLLRGATVHIRIEFPEEA
jgi:hypothetical protein